MKKFLAVAALAAGCCVLTAQSAQQNTMKMDHEMKGMQMGDKKAPLSPPKKASADVGGAQIAIGYSAPSMRGRKIFGGLVPYGQWWRTGANEATSFVTSKNLKVGSLNVPAGKYTLVTIPSEGTWKLVVCKHTGQWGTERFEKDDLGQTDMKKAALSAPLEQMVIDFEKTSGKSTELHIKWEKTDVYVPVQVE